MVFHSPYVLPSLTNWFEVHQMRLALEEQQLNIFLLHFLFKTEKEDIIHDYGYIHIPLIT